MTSPTVRVDEIATALGIARVQAAEQLAACGIETFTDRSGRSVVTVADAYRLADAHRQARDELATVAREHSDPEAESAARLAVVAYLAATPQPRPDGFRCIRCNATSGEPCRAPQGTPAGRPHTARRARAIEANRRRLDDAQRAGQLAYAAHLDADTIDPHEMRTTEWTP